MDEPRATDILRALELFQEVVHIPDARRCSIGKPVSCDNLEHVLLLREASVGVLPCGRCCGLGAEGGKRALLDTRVHVRLVVVANIEDVVVAIDRARKRLDADICRAAVARETNDRAIVGLLPLRPQAGLDAREHGRRCRKRRDHRVVRKAQLGKVEADGAHATRRQCRHRVRTEHLQCRANRQASHRSQHMPYARKTARQQACSSHSSPLSRTFFAIVAACRLACNEKVYPEEAHTAEPSSLAGRGIVAAPPGGSIIAPSLAHAIEQRVEHSVHLGTRDVVTAEAADEVERRRRAPRLLERGIHVREHRALSPEGDVLLQHADRRRTRQALRR